MHKAVNNIDWNWKVYKKWFRTRPMNLKWMLLVIIAFPFFATTWEMKKSGFSPLQVLGLMVFVFGFMSTIRKKSTTPTLTLLFYFFLFLLTVNLLLVFGYEGSFSQFGDTIRTLLPFILFFYFRRHLNSVSDLEGFLITFLIASIFPIGTLFYEILFSPIREVYNTESRGGGLRLSGFYADLFGYMSHLICGYIAYCYFYIKNIDKKNKHFAFGNMGFVVVLIITLIGIYNLRHQASWAVSLTILLIFVYYIRKKVSVLQLFVFFIVLLGVGFYFYIEIFNTLFAKDIAVYEGGAKDTAALNGRVYIWKKYFAYWENFSIFAQYFGSGFSFHESSSVMMSGGMHNDYVRLFFSTGIIGIICYVFFLFQLLKNAVKIRTVELKFLMLGSVMVVIMYSISALPLLASGAMMYFIMAVISQTNKKLL
ncbi:O-antigen ligase-like membrane protein [Gelidibacter sediminis]|uniref:O-antigen ligase-like membrane protein n=1 Tax=Gelidibacter sediminis TaxID=1608710 RepID=A0A4V3F9S8_9FLAO|nr:O-antigen ligase family protein [Gelidibacter sediminis]TDU42886.1 O-antigen ligase-like membrane protein [Gelidibacter sediminis]